MSNHYFIGIGGTGGNVVRELRKAEYLRSAEIEECGGNLKLGFLYVDSNELELNSSRQTWQVLGNSVELPPANRLLIKTGNLAEALRNVGERPNITKWIGDPAEVAKLLGAEGGVPGAQQRRRFGRFLFATHIPDFRGKINTKVREMQEGGRANCTFHLIGTLAGGTGSGALVDAALQIRALYPSADTYKVILYALITDDAADTADAGYFYENQYAALKDINAVMVGKARIHDLNSPLGSIFEGDRKLDQPIHRCVLLSNRNQHRITLSKEKQEKILADWLMQISIAEAQGTVVDSTAGLGVEFQRALTSEDISPNYPAEPSSSYQRSYRFGAVGILRWSAPQPLILERLGLLLVQQMGNQILFNNLNKNTGEYLDRIGDENLARFLRGNSLSDLGLEPEAQLRDQNGRTLDFAAHWRKKLEEDTRQFEMSGRGALDGVRERAHGYFQTGFKMVGVERYFDQLYDDFTTRRSAQEISPCESLVNSVEASLRDAFLNGDLGLQDIRAALERLLTSLRDRKNVYVEQRANAQRQIDILEPSTLVGAASDWEKIGPLSRLFGRQKSLLRGLGNKLATYYTLKSRHKESEFLERATDAIRSGLSGLQRSVEDIIRTLESVQAAMRKEAIKLERQLQSPPDLTKIEVDREKLANMERELKRSHSHIASAAVRVRNSLFTDHTFYSRQRITAASLSDHLLKDCDKAAQRAHNELTQDARLGLDPVIGVNLLEVLYRKHGGEMTEQLRQEIEDFISEAVVALEIDNTATQPRMILGGDAPSMPSGRLLIQVPARPAIGDGGENDRMANFEAELKKRLRESIQGDIPISMAESTDSTEITAVSVVSWMASRFASASSGLKRKYKSTMEQAGDQKNARYFCHLNDDTYETLPDLFPADMEIVRKEAKAVIDLGIMCEVVKQNQENKRLFLLKNHGQDPEELAESMSDYMNGSNSELERSTEEILGELRNVSAAVREEALQRAEDALKAWAKEGKDRNISPEYLDRKKELRQFRQLLDQLQ